LNTQPTDNGEKNILIQSPGSWIENKSGISEQQSKSDAFLKKKKTLLIRD
jgi:hypothetical protein